jgi:predicted phage baseplate assembly protein
MTDQHGHDPQSPGGIAPNPPGRSALSYRSGVHGTFLQRMTDALDDRERPGFAAFTARAGDDVTLGLLDAFASMGDVLTFYQERIANEHYLGTALERQSIRGLAGLVDYRLSPGKAADVHLAFELDTAADSPREVPLSLGLRADSVPGPGETLETFETIDDFVARPEWNGIRPRMTRPVTVKEVLDNEWALIEGTGLNINVGDRLMIVDFEDGQEGGDAETRVMKKVGAVEEDPTANTTTVEFGRPAAALSIMELVIDNMVATQAMSAATTGAYSSSWMDENVESTVWHHHDLAGQATAQGQSVGTLQAALIVYAAPPDFGPESSGISIFRVAASVFGHDARPMEQIAPAPTEAEPDPALVTRPADDYPSTLDEELLDEVGSPLPLSTEEKDITIGSWVALDTAGTTLEPSFAQVGDTDVRTVERYQRAAKVSTLRLSPTDNDDLGARSTRTTTVHAAPERLALAELPISEDVAGDTVSLDRPYLYLHVGQAVAIRGERADLPGVTAVEIRTIKEARLFGGVSIITLNVALDHEFRRETVTIAANLVRATHGASVERVLGSGDATVTFQTFVLPDAPLTFVAADTPSGARSTLEIRVDGVRWAERDNLAAAGRDERVFMARQLENGTTRVTFGDGVNGARLPTGVENVVASYRVGQGRPGLVDAGQVSLLASKPLGVKGVVNPSPSANAAPATSLEEARTAAPSGVTTLGRVVSLRDHEDFARNVMSIAKAHASWVWIGDDRAVVVTIAGVDGAVFAINDDTKRSLTKSLAAAGDGSATAHVVSYRPAYFILAMKLIVDAAHDVDIVVTGVERRLREAYAFERRRLGASVFRSEVIATVQSCSGVIAVDLDVFDRSTAATPGRQSRLDAALPRRGRRVDSAGDLEGAELLLVDARPIAITVAEVRAR